MNQDIEKTDLQKRQQIIKTLAVGGLAVTAWNKPIVNSVLLPAHAQTTGMENTGTARLLYEYINPDTQAKVEEAAPFSYRLSKIDTTTGDFEIAITGTTPTTASLTSSARALDYFIQPAIGQTTAGILVISSGRIGGNVSLTFSGAATATGEIILTSNGNVGGLSQGTACTIRISFELSYDHDEKMLVYGDNPFTVLTGGSCNVQPGNNASFTSGFTVEFLEIAHVTNLRPTPITIIPTTQAPVPGTEAPTDECYAIEGPDGPTHVGHRHTITGADHPQRDAFHTGITGHYDRNECDFNHRHNDDGTAIRI